MDLSFSAVLATALITAGALVPITNPPGNAPVFLTLTSGLAEGQREAMARRVAVNCFVLLVAATFVGSHILGFFDISLPVVRVGGGLLVAATAWRLLTTEGPSSDAPAKSRELSAAEVSGRAFYPLTFPITVGPGSISIAITLGAAAPARGIAGLANVLGLLAGIGVAAAFIFLAYRFAPRVMRLLGDTGTVVFLRLSAFILLCIGVQICWDGVAELLAPWKPK